MPLSQTGLAQLQDPKCVNAQMEGHGQPCEARSLLSRALYGVEQETVVVVVVIRDENTAPVAEGCGCVQPHRTGI